MRCRRSIWILIAVLALCGLTTGSCSNDTESNSTTAISTTGPVGGATTVQSLPTSSSSNPGSTDVVGEGWQLGLSDVLLLSDVIVLGRIVSADGEVDLDGYPVDLVSVAVEEILLGAPDAYDSASTPPVDTVISVSAVHDQPLEGLSVKHTEDETLIIGLQPEPDERVPTRWRINFTAMSQPDGAVTFDSEMGQSYTDRFELVADGAQLPPTVETLVRLAQELHLAYHGDGSLGQLANLLNAVESGNP